MNRHLGCQVGTVKMHQGKSSGAARWEAVRHEMWEKQQSFCTYYRSWRCILFLSTANCLLHLAFCLQRMGASFPLHPYCTGHCRCSFEWWPLWLSTPTHSCLAGVCHLFAPRGLLTRSGYVPTTRVRIIFETCCSKRVYETRSVWLNREKKTENGRRKKSQVRSRNEWKYVHDWDVQDEY